MSGDWQLGLLGEWELRRGTAPVGANLPRKSKALLAVLALAVGTPVGRSRLAYLLWGERDESRGRHSLSQALVTIRRSLPAECGLSINEDSVSLDVGRVKVDALLFEERARGDDLDMWREAVRAYRGDFLENLGVRTAGFEAWCLLERERLRQLALSLHGRLIRELIDRGELAKAIETAERLTRFAPADVWASSILRQLRAEHEEQGGPRPRAAAIDAGTPERSKGFPLAWVSAAEAGHGLGESAARFGPVYLHLEQFDALPIVAVLALESTSDSKPALLQAMAFSNEIHAGLARYPQIRVIARQSSFRYGRRTIDARLIGRILGCRYLVDGTVTIEGRRLRCLVQLIDAGSGLVLWSERQVAYGDEWSPARDELCQQIVTILANRIIRLDDDRPRRTTERQKAALELVRRGERILHAYSAETNHRARSLFERAVATDPGCAVAVALIGRTHSLDWRYGWSPDRDRSSALSLEMAERAVALDDTEPRAHAELGWARLYHRDLSGSVRAYEAAIRLLPNDPDIIGLLADTVSYSGDPARALDLARRAKSLQPAYPDRTSWSEADALFALKRYPEVIHCIKGMENPAEGCRLAAASYALMGDQANARRMANIVRHRQPGFAVDEWVDIQPEADDSEREHFREGLVRAGLR